MRAARSVTDWRARGAVVRLHIGLEAPADLLADLAPAFTAAKAWRPAFPTVFLKSGGFEAWFRCGDERSAAVSDFIPESSAHFAARVAASVAGRGGLSAPRSLKSPRLRLRHERLRAAVRRSCRRLERARVEKAPQHVGGDAADVVVVAVVAEREHVGDGAGREYGAAPGGLEEHHVGAHQRVLLGVEAVHRGAVFLGGRQCARAQAVRTGQDHGVRRRAQVGIEAVDFYAHGAAGAHAVVADALALRDALQRKGHARVGGLGRQQVVAGVVVDHGREADADELLRREAAVAPERAGFAGAGQGNLAGARLPGARAADAAPLLDGGGRLRMPGAAPVKAVGAEREVAAAAVLVGHDGVHHGLALVLTVRERGQDPVAGDCAQALAVEFGVGDQVVVDALFFEPVDEVGVDGQVPRPAA